jgi:hypothetical protein
MSMSVGVEKIEKGDRIEVWFDAAPQPAAVVVCDTSEGVTIRTFQVRHKDSLIELNVQRGHTVKLLC